MRKFLLFFVFTPSIIYACINVMGTTLDGGKTPWKNKYYAQKFMRLMEETPDSKLKDIEAIKYNPNNLDEYAKKENNTEEFYNEELQSVKLVLSGDYPNGIAGLLKISEKYPNRYSTATNLGTAYELNGETELAIKWIKEGIRLNPISHEGSEWLHLLILETKLKMKGEENYFTKRHVVELPTNFTLTTNVNILDKTRSINDIGKAINHQLEERVLFVKPKDSVVADLFFTLGQVEAHTASVESAIRLLEISKLYSLPNQTYIENAMTDYRKIINIRKRNDFLMNIFYGLLFLGFVSYLIYKRKKHELFVLILICLILILANLTVPFL